MGLEIQSWPLVWALLLPLVCAAGVQALGRWPNLRDLWTVVLGLATFGCVTRLVGPVMTGETPALALPGWMPGLGMGFSVEPLGLLFGLVASGLWVVTSIYGFGYMRGHHEKNQTRFFTCFAIAISAALGIAFAGDLVTLFLFYEILTFSTYPSSHTTATRRHSRPGGSISASSSRPRSSSCCSRSCGPPSWRARSSSGRAVFSRGGSRARVQACCSCSLPTASARPL